MADRTPMSVWQILVESLKLYGENFWKFLVVVAIVGVPAAAVGLVNECLFWARRVHPSALDLVPIGIMFPLVLAGILRNGALTKSISEAYLGRELSAQDAYRFAFSKFLTLLGAGLLVGLIFIGGLILLIVPGIIFLLWYAVTVPSIIVEDLGAVAGMRRSKALAAGNVGRLFVLVLVVIVLSALVGIPAVVARQWSLIPWILARCVGMAVGIVLAPIWTGAWALMYYDLRLRKEGPSAIAQSSAPA